VLQPRLPRPGAASEILADRKTEHIVEITNSGWAIRHPLAERLDDALMTCERTPYEGVRS
jgi:hypothetical protein